MLFTAHRIHRLLAAWPFVCLVILQHLTSGQDVASHPEQPEINTPPPQLQASPLAPLILSAVEQMPRGGAYAVNRKAAERLSKEAVVWDPLQQKLQIRPIKAQPSFCSEACYLVFLQALQYWEKQKGIPLSPQFWQYMAIAYGQSDGKRGWGRINANGPGMAKWIYDLRAGINFTELEKAQAGDFLKIFWTDEIGGKERGHFVIYLGIEEGPDGKSLSFWSSNLGIGYSKKIVPLSKIKRMLFTRITRPENLTRFHMLPETDSWLASLQKKRITKAEMLKACGIATHQKP